MKYEKLEGGNMSNVFRKVDIIYRSQGPWSSIMRRFHQASSTFVSLEED